MSGFWAWGGGGGGRGWGLLVRSWEEWVFGGLGLRLGRKISPNPEA